MHESDLRGKERVLAHESFGPVDRIDQPQIFSIDRALARLLSIKAGFGKTTTDDPADPFLRLHIGFGYRRFVRLDDDFEIALVIATNDLCRGLGRLECS